MWTGDHRRAANRRGLRYPSDLTDAEWELVRPFIRPAKRGGRPRSVDISEVLNAIFFVLSTGCQWNAIPSDLPPRSTVWDYLDLWEWVGTIARLHDALYVESRERAGRDASPTTAILDAQSAKGAVKGGARSTRQVTMPGRKSSVASAMSRRHAGPAAERRRPRRRYPEPALGLDRGTVTAPKHCCGRLGGVSPSSSVSLPMVVTPGRR